jgi:membrane protein YqaA with SNARE-associated domain
LEKTTRKKSLWAIYGLVFLESWIFPIPPDPFFIAVLLQNRRILWRITLLCTIFSVMGGIVGYEIGVYLSQWVQKIFVGKMISADSFFTVKSLLERWGGWLILVKGLTPFPYKIVCITAGVVGLSFPVFLVSSTVARGMRFVALGFLVHRYGHHVEPWLIKYRIYLRWLGLIIVGMGVCWVGYSFYRT